MDYGRIAKTLVDARRQGIRLASLPTPEPEDLQQAYLIQHTYIGLMDSPQTGWKVGATSDVGMQALGVDQPLAGPLFDNSTYQSPAMLQTTEDSMCIIEAEFAFSLAETLIPKTTDYTYEEVTKAIGTIHPAIEVVNTRCLDGFAVGPNWVVADSTANEAFIYGNGIKDWQQFDLPNHSVDVGINGAQAANGTGAAVLGNPLIVLHWLANHLSQRGISLKQGDFVSTGITTPVLTALSGDLIEADFGTLGLVELEIA